MAKTGFRVVTDSTADLPPAWREKYAIEVVPLKVLFGNESFRDGVDLTGDQFFERLEASQQLPTTSAPWSATISTKGSAIRSRNWVWARRISAAPGRKASTDPGSVRIDCRIASTTCRSIGARGSRPT